MSDRPRHQNKDIEAFMQVIELNNWTITKRKKYYQARCRCEGKHLKTIHLTPSGSMYLRNLRAWFARQPCWREAE